MYRNRKSHHDFAEIPKRIWIRVPEKQAQLQGKNLIIDTTKLAA